MVWTVRVFYSVMEIVRCVCPVARSGREMPQRMSLFEEHPLAHLGYSLCAYEARSNGAS